MLALDIQRYSEYARMAQEAEVALRRAQQKSVVVTEAATRERETESACIAEREHVERARLAMEREIEALETKKAEAHAIDEQMKEIALAAKFRERHEAQTLAEQAQLKVVEAREKVQTARDLEIANRQSAISLIEAEQQAQRDAIRLRTAAAAEKDAATDRAEADRITVAALKERLTVEAEGNRALNEAENLRSDANRRSNLHRKLVENLPAIIRESVKPIEKIDGIRIVHVEGLPASPAP